MVLVLGACGTSSPQATASPTTSTQATGLQKIQHIVVIMQENRSLDEYFGLYPGVDGLPRQNGKFTVCVPDPDNGGGGRRYHEARGRRAIRDAFRPAIRAARTRSTRTSWATRTLATYRTTGRTRTISCCRTACSNPTRRGAFPNISTSSPRGPRKAARRPIR